MKTLNRSYKGNDDVSTLLRDVLGQKAEKAVAILEKHRIKNIGQFSGALLPHVPLMSEKQLRQKYMVCSIDAFKKSKSTKNAIRKIRLTLGTTLKQAEQILESLKRVEKSSQSYRMNFNWAFGTKKTTKTNKPSVYWKSHRSRKKSGGFFVLPSYGDMGPVFDQGNRGTCVANAATSMIDYLGKERYSRQFLYHQCKMIDGSKNSEGTYIEMPFVVLEDGKYLDYGCVEEKIWPYDPKERDTTHHGPPPEEAFDCQRVVSIETIYPRMSSIVDDIKDLLLSGLPVVIGVPLYESFMSYDTYTNGWVIMPFDGETIYGYHAMLVVGYDEDMRMFLVRNSWSSSWASQNEKGYPGHALMPYEYIKEYCFSCATARDVYEEHVFVEPGDRLYNNSTSGKRKIMQRKAASQRKLRKKNTTLQSTKLVKGRRNITSSRKTEKKNTSSSWILKLVLIAILAFAFREPLANFAEKSFFYLSESAPIETIKAKAINILSNK
jgi:C1A family cysteine protease